MFLERISMVSFPLRVAVLLSLFAAASVLFAQRLPGGAHPDHYSLKLTPDLKAATFSGDETLDLTLDQASSAITLNALEIAFKNVTAGGNPATVSLDAAKQQATFTFAQPLPAGKNSIHIV
jgi:aminopeptidase N/puromycin-sensitive aminopeptidase